MNLISLLFQFEFLTFLLSYSGCIEKYVQILEAKFKNELLMNVYAAVNHKAVDDPDMQAFFKFKMWL